MILDEKPDAEESRRLLESIQDHSFGVSITKLIHIRKIFN